MDVVSRSPLQVSALRWQPRAGAHAITVACAAAFDVRPLQSPFRRAPSGPGPSAAAGHDLFAQMPPDVRAAAVHVPFKRRGEVLLTGHAHAPEGEPVLSLHAHLAVGAVDKSIVVHADRTLLPDGRVVTGEPFTRMPLVWERAAGSPYNPVGVPPPVAGAPSKLPNLEPRGAGRAPFDILPPVGFGPVPPNWPSRLAALGRHASTWDAATFHTRPLPDDVDAAFFNAAPPDQQLAELHGDEVLVLEGLHPTYARLSTRLATVVPRCSVLRLGAAEEELKLRCDTLWIDADRGIAVLIWRATLPLTHAAETGRLVITASIPEPEPRGADPGEHTLVVGPAPASAAAAPTPFSPRGAPAPATPAPASMQGPPAVVPRLSTSFVLSASSLAPAAAPAAPPGTEPPKASAPGPRKSGFDVEESTAVLAAAPAPEPPPRPAPGGRRLTQVLEVGPPAAPVVRRRRVTQILEVGEAPPGHTVLPFQPSAPVPAGFPPAAPPEPLVARESAPESITYTNSIPEEPDPLPPLPGVAPPPMIGPLAGLIPAPATEPVEPPPAAPVAGPAAESAPAPPPDSPEPAPARSAGEAEPAEPEVEELPLERTATVAADLGEGRKEREKIFESHAVTAKSFRESELRWMKAIAKESMRGVHALRGAWDAAYVARVEKHRGPITTMEYAKILTAFERSEAGEMLDSLSIHRGALFPILRHWTSKVARDSKLGEAATGAVRDARRA